MPAVFLTPLGESRAPATGSVARVHRRPGHYAGEGDPVVDLQVGPHVVTLCAPFAGKIMLCRDVGYVAKAGERVFETTSVGTATWEIFVSYRQADAPGHAGRLAERLVRQFGPGQVFKDLDSLILGEEYVAAIRAKLQRAFVMIVIIGPSWQSDARLQQPDDLHREEISTALQRGIEVVPVLVNGATMPNKEDLPDDLKELVGRQGLSLPETYWSAGVDRVVQHVESVLERSPRRLKFLAQVPPWDYSGWMYVEDEP